MLQPSRRRSNNSPQLPRRRCCHGCVCRSPSSKAGVCRCLKCMVWPQSWQLRLPRVSDCQESSCAILLLLCHPKLRLACTCAGLHFEELFPVQAAVWSELAGGASSAHDLCIAAPTGSGKTLAYALPVVNGLARCAAAQLCTRRARHNLPTAQGLSATAQTTRAAVVHFERCVGRAEAGACIVCRRWWCCPHVTWRRR